MMGRRADRQRQQTLTDGLNLQLEPEWLEYTVLFEEAGITSDKNQLTNIQFMTKGKFDFWIDDLAFLEEVPNCCSSLPDCQDGIAFADPSLRALMWGVGPDGKLGCDRACAARSVSLAGTFIESLEGMECLSQLDELTLTNTSVADLAPLAGAARLHAFTMDGGAVQDLAPLGTLPALRTLELDGNQVVDVRPLAKLVGLQVLSLRKNRITSPVAALSGLRELTYLDLTQNRIASVGPLSGLPKLTELALSSNELTDIEGLAVLSQLQRLELAHNQIGALTGPFAFDAIALWDLSDNGLSSIAEGALEGTSVAALLLADNQLAKLSALADVNFYRAPASAFGCELDLSNDPVEDLSPLLSASWCDSFTVRVDGAALDCAAQAENIQALRARGATVNGCP